jgi:tetratricopeptide (TPR) repeat protein
MKCKSPAHRFHCSNRTFSRALLFTVILSGAITMQGQGRRLAEPPQPPPELTKDQALVLYGTSADQSFSKQETSCFLPPLTGVDRAMVQVVDLQVPAKVQKDYQDGCSALRAGKMTAAENHLRKVVKEYEGFAAAWIALGQVMEVRQKTDEARNACSHPLTSLANYLPAYLCLTDISARLNRWDEVLKLSGRALEIDPTASAAAYAYNATAALNLHHLNDAEKSALRALEIDSNHSDPRLHYLLAQIYGAKGDLASAAAQLREYLKFATDPDDTAVVKNYLAKLEGQSGK